MAVILNEAQLTSAIANPKKPKKKNVITINPTH